MARQVFAFDPPERFVAGTVGQPGDRTFYLQARTGARTVSVALEKQQVSVLAERVEALLNEVLRRSGGTAAIPTVAPAQLDDDRPLDLPVEEEFRVGTMALAWDPQTERVLVEAQAVTEDGEASDTIPDEDELDGPALLRVRMTASAARAFAKRALAVVSAGRPPCPFCSLPLDPEGHVCPRANGYRR